MTHKKQYVEGDSDTRLWEIEGIAYGCGVVCESPFHRMLPMGKDTRTIAKSRKFDSREQQDQIVAIIVKALSSYNHAEVGRVERLDGKKITEEENKERVKLLLDISNRSKYLETYKRKSWMRKAGPVKVVFTSYVTSSLENGGYIL